MVSASPFWYFCLCDDFPFRIQHGAESWRRAVVVVIWLFFGLFILVFAASVTFRLIVLHPLAVPRYGLVDLFKYFKYKQYNECKTGELVAYVGLFGKGKTLSAVHKVCTLYHLYNGKDVWDAERGDFVIQRVKIISNVHLSSVPYERFVSLEQIVLAADLNRKYDEENHTRTITLVLGDEFSVQLNSRSFKTNINPLFLNTVLTCRHHHISLYYTAQRFAHVDALLRQVTSYVVSCDKLWRLQRHYVFDAWEMENATNPQNIRPVRRTGFFVFNRDYDAYDTLACVGNLKKAFEEGDMLSEQEILELQCNQGPNMDAVAQPSRRYLRSRKKMH